jgi:hypothetical protein
MSEGFFSSEQAPMVPNETVIEAMIKGLHVGPEAQYFARKPPVSRKLEKLFQKLDGSCGALSSSRHRCLSSPSHGA